MPDPPPPGGIEFLQYMNLSRILLTLVEPSPFGGPTNWNKGHVCLRDRVKGRVNQVYEAEGKKAYLVVPRDDRSPVGGSLEESETQTLHDGV